MALRPYFSPSFACIIKQVFSAYAKCHSNFADGLIVRLGLACFVIGNTLPCGKYFCGQVFLGHSLRETLCTNVFRNQFRHRQGSFLSFIIRKSGQKSRKEFLCAEKASRYETGKAKSKVRHEPHPRFFSNNILNIVTLDRAVSFCVFQIGFLQCLNKRHEVYFMEADFVST